MDEIISPHVLGPDLLNGLTDLALELLPLKVFLQLKKSFVA